MATAVDAFLDERARAGASANTVAAYRRDLLGVLRRLPLHDGARPELLPISALGFATVGVALRSWAGDHAPSSVRRAWSAWNAFFDYLLAHRLAAVNPMSDIERPRHGHAPLRSLPAGNGARRLLAVAAGRDPRSRQSWPERDVALVALVLGTGVRLGELTRLTLGSLQGFDGGRQLVIVDAQGRARSVPVEDGLAGALDHYLSSRGSRLPRQDLTDPTAPLLVNHDGGLLARHQAQYLVRRLYERSGLRDEVPDRTLVRGLRHAFAAAALDRGTSVEDLQERLGHGSLATTRRHARAAGRTGASAGETRLQALRERREQLAATRKRLKARIEAVRESEEAWKRAHPDQVALHQKPASHS